MQIDFNSMDQMAKEASDADKLPEGEYLFAVDKLHKIAPSSKGEGINVGLIVVVAEGPETGRTSYYNLYVPTTTHNKPFAFTMSKRNLAVFGFTGGDLEKHFTALAEQAPPYQFIGEAVHDAKDDRVNINDIRAVDDAGSGPGAPASNPFGD